MGNETLFAVSLSVVLLVLLAFALLVTYADKHKNDHKGHKKH
jgi:hypothetical protein